MGLEFKDRLVGGPENGHGMAVGSMHPLDGVRRGQDGAREGGLALADVDAEAPKNDKPLCRLATRSGRSAA